MKNNRQIVITWARFDIRQKAKNSKAKIITGFKLV